MAKTILPAILLTLLFKSYHSLRCYSCMGDSCSYKISHMTPSVECPSEYDMCQSLCYNWTINVHRCANMHQDCSTMRDKLISASKINLKKLFVLDNDGAKTSQEKSNGKAVLKVTDCFLCDDDLCNFNYLCENLKNAQDYEETGLTSTATTTTQSFENISRSEGLEENSQPRKNIVQSMVVRTKVGMPLVLVLSFISLRFQIGLY